MSRARWIVLWVLLLAVVAAGRGRPPKPKPKNAAYLGKTKLWYLLHVPSKYNPKKEKYPLLVVAPYRDDFAAASFQVWQGLAKHDRVFLAALNFRPGTKQDREKRYCDLVAELCRKYGGIDRKRLIFVGVEKGATQVIKFAAAYPRVFAVGVAVGPRSIPDLSKVKPSAKPRLIATATRLFVIYDPKNAGVRKQLSEARKRLQRLRIPVRTKSAPPVGLGKPSDEEAKIAQKVIRETYSSAKRTEVAMRLRQTAEAERKKREEERRKLAAAKAEEKEPAEPGKEPGKKPTEPATPDDVLLAAQEAYEKKQYAKALKLFQQLAKLAPDSEYSRLANERVKELEADPSVKRAMADAQVEKRARRLLTFARNFRRTGDAVKAAAHYKKVIAQFPGTSFAEEARRELATLEGQE